MARVAPIPARTRSNGIELIGIKKLDAIDAWIDSLEEVIRMPRVFRPLIRTGFASSITTLDTSGASGGATASSAAWHGVPNGRDWQPLSDFTNQKRYQRGYPMKEPILVQSGQLYQAAAVPFMKWGANTRRSSRSFNAPYGNHSNVKMTASISGNTFHATISGSRVANQWGGKIKKPKEYYSITGGRMYLPPRPFWYIDKDNMEFGAMQMLGVINTEWGKMAGPLLVKVT